jgi:organic radical activating enzyme
MFGNNPVRKYESIEGGRRVRVQDIFSTIQGEGPFAGMPAIFIRLAGCNLRCLFCDTDFESRYYDEAQRVEDVVAQVRALEGPLPVPLIVITGGEPFRQDIGLLLQELVMLHSGDEQHIQIETAGTLWPPSLDEMRWLPLGGDMREVPLSIVLSPKTPEVSPAVRVRTFAWKYIIAAGQTADDDGLPIASTQNLARIRLARPLVMFPRTSIYVQPMDVQPPSAQAANIKEAVRVARVYGYRLSLQQHKILELP